MDLSVFSKTPLSARSCLTRFEILWASLNVLPLPKTSSIKPDILITESHFGENHFGENKRCWRKPKNKNSVCKISNLTVNYPRKGKMFDMWFKNINVLTPFVNVKFEEIVTFMKKICSLSPAEE